MFVVRLVFFPIKVGTKATKVAAKTGYRTGRLLGYRRLFVFGLGIAVGLMIAPGPGRELRAKLQTLLAGEKSPSDPELGDLVRFELSHSPRTWHLPQPEIEVLAGRDAALAPYGGAVYKAGSNLPTLVGSARAYKVVDGAGAAVQRLAGALGLADAVQDANFAFSQGDASLTVAPPGGGWWSYA